MATTTSAVALAVLLAQCASLIPRFYICQALLMSMGGPTEWSYRSAVVIGQGLGVASGMCWNAFHPSALRLRTVARLAAVSAALTSLHLALAYQWSGYAASTLVPASLEVLSRACLVPLRQFVDLACLNTKASLARWRMGGWCVTLGLTLAMLNFSDLLTAQQATMFVGSAAPALFALAILGGGSDGLAVSGGGGAAASGGGGGDRRVSLRTCAAFAATVFVDKNGEAIMDSATGLYVRDALAKGRSSLAKATASSTLAATVLSLLTELVVGGRKGKSRARGGEDVSPSGRAVLFVLIWGGSQLVRIAALPRLVGGDGDTDNAALLWALTFLDKFSGPLGDLAAEFVALEVLRRGLMRASKGVSGQCRATEDGDAPRKRRNSGAREAGAGASALDAPLVSVGFLTSSRAALINVTRPALELCLMSFGHDVGVLVVPVSVLVAAECALVLQARRREQVEGPTVAM